ncbi:APC family permease [Rhodococcus sp. NPDC057529]|uniref:APC family permease n=1 Tax=Rhodococcus sp. NPDC057529 TaxID=3346158 RepID=UPI00366C8E84
MQSDGGFQRKITLWQLIAIAVTIQIGASWLFAPLATAGLAGPAAIFTWVFGALVFAIMAIPWLEISTALPRTGVSVRGPQFTHGSLLSWMNGWGYLVALVTLPPIEALVALTYLGGQFPQLGLLHVVDGVTLLTWPIGVLTATALVFVFFLLNIFGVQLLARATAWLSVWKIVIPFGAAALMFTAMKSENFTEYGGFAPLGGSAVMHAVTAGGIVMAFNGIRVIADLGGESVNPRKHLPIGMIVGGLLIPLAFYLALQIGFIGVIDWDSLGIAPGAWSELASSNWASSPLVHALGAAGFVWFGTLLLIDAVGAPAITGMTMTGVAGRTAYANSVNGALPAVMQRLNRHGVPWVAMLACTLVSLVFLAPFPSWYQMVGIVSTALVLSYLVGSPLVMVLRRTAPGLDRPVRVPAVTAVCVLAHAVAVTVIYFAGWWTLVNLMTVFFLAIPVAASYIAPRLGWFSRTTGLTIAGTFTAAWIVLAWAGGWIMSTAGTKRSGAPLGDLAYIAVMIILVVAVLGAMWMASNPDGKKQTAASIWLPASLLAVLVASYLTDTSGGGDKILGDTPTLALVFIVGIASAWWAAHSGYETDELRALLAETANTETDTATTPSSPQSSSGDSAAEPSLRP